MGPSPQGFNSMASASNMDSWRTSRRTSVSRGALWQTFWWSFVLSLLGRPGVSLSLFPSFPPLPLLLLHPLYFLYHFRLLSIATNLTKKHVAHTILFINGILIYFRNGSVQDIVIALYACLFILYTHAISRYNEFWLTLNLNSTCCHHRLPKKAFLRSLSVYETRKKNETVSKTSAGQEWGNLEMLDNRSV